MLKLTVDQPESETEERDSLLFPAEAVRLLGVALPKAPASRGRAQDFVDPIRRVEDALERVESQFARLRAQFNGGDDHPRAA